MTEIKIGDILTFPKGVWATIVKVEEDKTAWVKNFMFGQLFYGAPVKFPFYEDEKLISEEGLCFGTYKVIAEEMGIFCFEKIETVEPEYILVKKQPWLIHHLKKQQSNLLPFIDRP